MGVDYCRFRVRGDEAVLDPLIQKQSVAFQSMWGWHSDAASQVGEVGNAILREIHFRPYVRASKELRALLEIPSYDQDQRRATDVPDLDTCWRVSVIAGNSVFPPLWRVQAYRTIKASELADQVAQWRTWASEVAAGMHEHYLRWLHLHYTSDFLRYHWSYLRTNAVTSRSKQAKWANTPEVNDIRNEVISLAEPQVIAAPVLPSACSQEVEQEQYDHVQELAQKVNELTRSWNYHAKRNFRLPDYLSNYFASLAAFRRQATNEWLTQFFGWAQRCTDEGFGLYLDY